jgi:homogentisate 1,2-dioxygenase
VAEPRTLIQHSRGVTARQTHRDLPGLREDLLTRGGFDGRNALLYRRHQPTTFRAEGRFRMSDWQVIMVETRRPLTVDDGMFAG